MSKKGNYDWEAGLGVFLQYIRPNGSRIHYYLGKANYPKGIVDIKSYTRIDPYGLYSLFKDTKPCFLLSRYIILKNGLIILLDGDLDNKITIGNDQVAQGLSQSQINKVRQELKNKGIHGQIIASSNHENGNLNIRVSLPLLLSKHRLITNEASIISKFDFSKYYDKMTAGLRYTRVPISWLVQLRNHQDKPYHNMFEVTYIDQEPNIPLLYFYAKFNAGKLGHLIQYEKHKPLTLQKIQQPDLQINEPGQLNLRNIPFCMYMLTRTNEEIKVQRYKNLVIPAGTRHFLMYNLACILNKDNINQKIKRDTLSRMYNKFSATNLNPDRNVDYYLRERDAIFSCKRFKDTPFIRDNKLCNGGKVCDEGRCAFCTCKTCSWTTGTPKLLKNTEDEVSHVN